MSERYLITGVQLGLLHETNDKLSRSELINEIVDKQFIGNSTNSVEKDADMIYKKELLR